MATTTPNFGWAVPTSTDLVKDGAVAIETLGDSIDASLVDLKGGTTGQVLAKATNTDMDFTWSTPSAGGGGKVLQVVYGSTNTQVTSSTTTFAATNLTATITPTASTSTILVLIGQQGLYKGPGNAVNSIKLRLMRGATSLYNITDLLLYTNTASELVGSVSAVFRDSPATTSATTYSTEFANYVGASQVGVQFVAGAQSMTSTITLLEIGA